VGGDKEVHAASAWLPVCGERRSAAVLSPKPAKTGVEAVNGTYLCLVVCFVACRVISAVSVLFTYGVCLCKPVSHIAGVTGVYWLSVDTSFYVIISRVCVFGLARVFLFVYLGFFFYACLFLVGGG